MATSVIALDDRVHPHCLEAAAAEAMLTDIWRRSLGPKRRDTSGHILHTTMGLRRLSRFINEAEAALGVRMPPSVVMQLGTIKAMASALAAGRLPPSSPLVLLRDGDPRQTLYITSAGSGLIIEMCDMAQCLAFPGQIWGLQPPGVDGEATPLSSIADIARYYVEAILARDEPGTCNVIGYSFGGLVAFEMAHQFKAAGRTMGLVGLLDTGLDEKFWPRSAWLQATLQKARRRLATIRAMPAGAAISYLGGRVAALGRHMTRRINASGDVNQSVYYIGDLEPDFQRVRDASIVAFQSYVPTRIDHPVVLFKSMLGDQHACDPVYIWKHRTPRLEVVMVPGSHITMVRLPHAERLSSELSLRLQ